MKLSLINLFLLFFTSSLCTPDFAQAIEVTNVKDKKILIDLEGATVNVDDEVIAIIENDFGGTAKILQTRSDQAVAIITHGAFSVGQKLVKKSSQKKYPTPTQLRIEKAKKLEEEDIVYRSDLTRVALSIKLLSNEMSTKQADGTLPFPLEETVSMSGHSIGFSGSIDYPVYDWMTARGTVSYDPLRVSGNAVNNSCDNKSSKACSAQISYLSMAGHFRYDLNKSRSSFWVAGGGALKIPLRKSSSSLNDDDIKMANSLIASIGLDHIFQNRYYMPIVFEYQYSLNTSETVPKIDIMSLQVGFGWQL